MKSVLIAMVAALVLPLPAAAQSLGDTHEVVWQPAGKTAPVLYRERGRAACAATAGHHHQAGKGAMPAKKKCAAVEAAKAPAPTADAAISR